MGDSNHHKQQGPEGQERVTLTLKSPMASAPAASSSSAAASSSSSLSNAASRSSSGPSGAGAAFSSPRSLTSGATTNPFFVDDPFEHLSPPASAPAGPIRSLSPVSSSSYRRKDRTTRRSADVLLHVRAIDNGEGGCIAGWPLHWSLIVSRLCPSPTGHTPQQTENRARQQVAQSAIR